MPSSSLFPRKINHLCSRFKSSTKNSDTLNSTQNQMSSPHFIRPSPLKVPPSSVGLEVDPRSWVQSNDNEDDSSDDETLVKNGTVSTSIENDDEVPLSQLCKHGHAGLLTPSTPRLVDSTTSKSNSRSDTSSLHRPSLSLHSSLSAHPNSTHHLKHISPSHKNHDHHLHPMNAYTSPQTLQPLAPLRTLRPAMSSPNLFRDKTHSHTTPLNLPCSPMSPGSHSQTSSIGIHSSRYTPVRVQHIFPSHNSQLGTPPPSISPPARTHKLSSPLPPTCLRSSDSDVHRRMKQRHKGDLQHLHHHHQPSVPSINIDPSLYSMLNDAQRSALRQRSDFLGQNLKIHLESFAHEMIQSNIRQQSFHGVRA